MSRTTFPRPWLVVVLLAGLVGAGGASHPPIAIATSCTDVCLSSYGSCASGAGGDPEILEICRDNFQACVAGCAMPPACLSAGDCLWPSGCGFASEPDLQIFFSVPVYLRNLLLTARPPCTSVPPSGPFQVDSFFDVFVEVTFDNGSTWQSHTADGQGRAIFTPQLPISGGQPFLTEMVQLDISGGSLPSGMRLREHTGASSPGATLDRPGSGFDSFFDVYFELSLDGGQTWNTELGNLRLTLGPPQPTPARPATWGSVKLLYR